MNVKNFIILSLLIILGFYYRKNNHLNEEREILIHLNDSLSIITSELYSSIDSLNREVVKVDSIIIEVERIYEKNFIDISNQSITSDTRFFSEYLSKNSARFFNSNNSTAIKAN